MTVFISILAVLVILGVLATAHELGHFFVARLFGVTVYEVSIFVGPTLFKWKHKGVEYSLRCIPLGAYVRFSEIDENGNELNSKDPHNLLNQPRWKRLIISLAGPCVNLILGVIIFMIYYSVSGFITLNLLETYEGSQLYSQQYEVGDEIVAVDNKRIFTEDELYIYLDLKPTDEETVLTLKSQKTGEKYDVHLVPEKSRKVLMGLTRLAELDPKHNGWEIVGVDEFQNNGNPVLEYGDFLVSIDDISVANESEVLDYLATKVEGDTVHVKFYRDDVEMEGDIVLAAVDTINPLGIVLERVDMKENKDFFGVLETSFKMPLSIFHMTGMVISEAISGKVEIYNIVSGPVGVVNAVDTVVSNQRADTGIKITTLIMLAGMISVGLSITNMLPLPGLDGFQLIVLIIEMVIGRKMPEKGEKIIAVIGFFVLLLLVILAFASDIAKIVIEGW
ncbi:MAG: RIP metalloprotease RseP [Clostridia bacterium]|nr:RIP metalloprotease RseP [Clostridia bacterium]